MQLSQILSLLALATSFAEAGRSLQHVGKKDKAKPRLDKRAFQSQFEERAETSLKPRYLTNVTEKFAVNGSAIPEVDFDIGESYAGLLPISSAANETSQLYFVFNPSTNTDADDEILIWLNGGPGCSSLEGYLQENGPFLWQYGTYAPVRNPYTWVNLTNVVWIEQPVGTGFSQGTPTATSEADVAAQFLGFWKNFINTFSLQGRKVYITGESYAGYYVPYIADAMLNTNDTIYYNLEGTLIYDPSTSSDMIQEQIPALQFAEYWGGLFPFNDTFRAQLHAKADSCGYTDYISKYLTFPPPGPFPVELPGTDSDGNLLDGCDVFDDVFNGAIELNPCFDIYQVATTCPLLWDVLGFPGSFDYVPEGADIYFNRTDVKTAMNAPQVEWFECTPKDVFVGGDSSVPSGLSVLPGVIERSKRTIIAHGALDMVLISNGTLLMIQNMTWGGQQGFQTKPTAPFYVPAHTELSDSTLAGTGVFGTTHTERGLTWVSVDLAGHMVPQYAPTAAYRQVEFLLGRIDSLSEVTSFTTDPVPQANYTLADLGNGTAPPVKRRRDVKKSAAMLSDLL